MSVCIFGVSTGTRMAESVVKPGGPAQTGEQVQQMLLIISTKSQITP